MKVIRFSGVRLQGNYTYIAQLQTLVKTVVEQAGSLFTESLNTPYLYWDNERTKSLEQIVGDHLCNGEVFIAYDEDKPAGFASFRNIVPGRHAFLEIFILPEYRKGHFLKEFRKILYDAAFSEYPKGLQLLKIKASISPHNTASIKACLNSGFVKIATIPYEGLYDGKVSDMLLMEKYANELQNSMQGEVIQNGSTTRTNKRKPVRSRAAVVKHGRKL